MLVSAVTEYIISLHLAGESNLNKEIHIGHWFRKQRSSIMKDTNAMVHIMIRGFSFKMIE